MPELPEVETIKRDLGKCIVGQRIADVTIRDTMVVRFPKNSRFKVSLVGKEIAGVERRGKAIIFRLSQGGFLIVQLAMTGQLIYGEESKTSCVSLKLSNGQFLNYNDTRRFGRLNVVANLSDFKFLKSLGPEPLGEEFNCAWLKQELKKHKAPIKSLLMNQNFVAGIGNIYASEILFRSNIRPQKKAYCLKPGEVELLRQRTIEVLTEAIELRGSSVNTYRDLNGQKGSFVNRIQVYGREDQMCIVCQTPIKKVIIAGRSTFFCRRCQS